MKIEACDLTEGQYVFWDGKQQQIESVNIDNGTILSVEVTFKDQHGVYKFTEGDYLIAVEPEPFVTLEDHGDGGEPGFDPKGVKIFIDGDSRWMWIRPEGYGEATAQDGCGAPIGLEYYNGRLRLIVYSDINEQDPQIIDLEDARESNRKEQ
jgi:hypothetical protein